MEDYNSEDHVPQSSVKGYKMVMVILVVILAALSFLYLRQVRELKQDNVALEVERDTLANRFSNMVEDFDNMKSMNETMSQDLEVERSKADSLLERLTKERRLSYAKIKAYEKELGTLRVIMSDAYKMMDSLNNVNQKLAGENVTMRQEIGRERQRADIAEERVAEQSNKLRRGSVIKARNIELLALNNSDREVTRASQARRLRVDFMLAANDIANAGSRDVFAVITGPEGYVLGNPSGATFTFEGDRKIYSAKREIDYQNQDLPVGIYYTGSGIVSGKYNVALYMDGYMIGRTDILLK